MTTTPASNPSPLSWLRVVDLTDLRGAMCARILADLGADVLHVQRSETSPEEVASTAHRYRNANKRGVTLDPRSAEGRARLNDLLAQADILVENLGNRERASLDLMPDAVSAAFPELIHVALTDLGLSGPRSDWRLEPIAGLAASGTLHASGFSEMPPCNAPGHLAHDCASVYGAVGAVAAALDRARHGLGQLVEVSTQEAALAATVLWSIALEDYRKIIPTMAVDNKRNGDGSYWVLPASDGWIRTVTGTQRQWEGFVELLRSEELKAPEWQDRTFRLENFDVLRAIAGTSLVDRTREELFAEAKELGTAVGVINSVTEFVCHEQTKQRGYFAVTGFPHIGEAPFAQHPVNLSVTPASIRRPAPESGEEDGGQFSPRPADAAAVLSSDELLLSGIRVIEFGVAAVVPELCGVLSELGAEVIKIESLAHPDLLRQAGGGRINCSFAFNAECRGRQSVALDLNTAEGRELAMALCASADVIAENQRGGVLEKLGLGYDDVKLRNPTVIYASSQGYGRGGPYGEMPAYGPLNTGFAGSHLLWNHPDAPYPAGTTLTFPDHLAGKLLAVSVLAALNHRERTGEGQRLEMAQTESVAYFLGEVYIDAHHAGVDPAPLGNRHPAFAPHGVYPCAGEDQWVAIAVVSDPSWMGLCAALDWEGRTSLAAEERIAIQESLDAELSVWTRQRTPEAAAAELQSHGVSAMPVMGPIEHHADPHLRERQFVVTLNHPEVGEERHAGNPIKMSRLRQRLAASAPCLGADTEDVLANVAGLTRKNVADLRDRGICR